MKKIILSMTMVTLCAIGTAMAQPPHPTDNEKIKQDFHTLQSRVIEQNLALTGEKLETFREIYNNYSAELETLTRNRPLKRQSNKLTDEQIEQNILDSFSRSKKSIETKEKYYKKFREILTPRQINKMYRIERITRDKINTALDNRNEKEPVRP